MPFELFSTAVTRPDAVFCDASFILDVLTYEVPTVAATITDLDAVKQVRAAEAASFFYNYSAAGTQFVSSPYTLQEVANTLGNHVLRNRKAGNNWANLKRTDHARFLALRAEALSIIEDAWTRFQAHDIWFVVPNDGDDTPQGKRISSELVETAHLLLRMYAALDAMDAFHISTGLACGLEWFVTTDAGWKDVAEINVFCDK
ncbi:MAG TPA: hypothetical protein VFQ76_06585 [Longimicrobiaceae bacterium]|nr:hypothetical protein [Longimicrobiaceae bacterium]